MGPSWLLGMCGIDFFLFRFGFSSVFEINSDSVRNEFGLVQKNAVWFGYYSYSLLM